MAVPEAVVRFAEGVADAFAFAGSVSEMVYRAVAGLTEEERGELRAFLERARAQPSPADTLRRYNEVARMQEDEEGLDLLLSFAAEHLGDGGERKIRQEAELRRRLEKLAAEGFDLSRPHQVRVWIYFNNPDLGRIEASLAKIGFTVFARDFNEEAWSCMPGDQVLRARREQIFTPDALTDMEREIRTALSGTSAVYDSWGIDKD